MPKMQSTVDGHEFDATDEEARDLQARGAAFDVEAAKRQAAEAAKQGNYSSITGRPDSGVAEAPESLSAPGTPDQHNDEPPESEEEANQPVKTPSQASRKR